MEKVIIRTKAIRGISSKMIRKDSGVETLSELVSKYGKNSILKDVFEETDFTYEELCEEQNNFIQRGYSSVFMWMYRMDSEYGIGIDSHIYLYRYNLNISRQQQEVFGWEYGETSRYLCDTWWFDDEEVLEDIQSLSAVSFFEKYRLVGG